MPNPAAGRRYSLANPQWIVPDQIEIQDAQGVLYGRIAEYVLMASFVVCMAVYEWIRSIFNQPPQPAMLTMFAGLMILYAGARAWLLWPRLRALKAVANGHRELRHEIEGLGGRGYFFFEPPRRDRSVVPSGAVLVGPNGIFALTVRSFSRGENPYEKIRHKMDGSLTVAGREALASPLKQAERVTEWVRVLLDSATGKKYAITPVLACPGWKIANAKSEVGRDVVVVNENTFVETILGSGGGERLQAHDVIAICEALDGAFGGL